MVGGGALGAVTYLRGGLLPRPPPEGLPVLLGPLAGVLLIGFLHRPGFRVSSTGPGTAAPCCSVVLKVVCGLEVACLHLQSPFGLSLSKPCAALLLAQRKRVGWLSASGPKSFGALVFAYAASSTWTIS